jgi:hypothetical protein
MILAMAFSILGLGSGLWISATMNAEEVWVMRIFNFFANLGVDRLTADARFPNGRDLSAPA